jgi:hypothetical protein
MMRTLVGILFWLAVGAGANIGPLRQRWMAADGAAVLVAVGQTVGPNRAGRLVPVPDDTLEPDVGRSLVFHWALWAAVALIVLLLAAGYVRRRWKAHSRLRPARFSWLAWGRDHGRK